MKRLLLAGTAVLALVASGSAAHAQRFNFTYTGKLVTFTVPETGSYQILAFGAQGGPSAGASAGGRGAEIGGNFSLTAGEVLEIAVGGAAAPDTLGGGGGSFVVGPGNTPLIIAGGGGGGAVSIFGPTRGQGGLTGPNGGGQFGGIGGNGGRAVGEGFTGAGGGGFFSAGANSMPFPGTGPGAVGGGAFPGLAGGERGGGFGGGGGGGYSGGGGGDVSPAGGVPGGGGGSFDAGTDQILVADLQTGDGAVAITKVAPVFAGTPGKANCHGQSVSALARQNGGLNAAAAALGFDSVDALQQAIQEFCAG
jgi:hypothetical protein